jgi:hypothetical protein
MGLAEYKFGRNKIAVFFTCITPVPNTAFKLFIILADFNEIWNILSVSLCKNLNYAAIVHPQRDWFVSCRHMLTYSYMKHNDLLADAAEIFCTFYLCHVLEIWILDLRVPAVKP